MNSHLCRLALRFNAAVLMVFLILLRTSHGAEAGSRLDEEIRRLMEHARVPGLAACAMGDRGEVVWSGYYGYRDVERKLPVTKDTLFSVASVAKTITAAAVMQLVDAGKLRLEDDINQFLPFKLTNPHFPQVAITVGQLLRHRSSLRDNTEYLRPIRIGNNGDPKIPLGEFLAGHLAPDSEHFNAARTFFAERPDSAYHYSNTGFALLGYVVERIAGVPFEAYCRTNIFQPLGMTQTAWFLRDLEVDQVAMPSRFDAATSKYVNLGHVGYPDYPSGQLKTTAEDYARFLAAWTQRGQFRGKQVLADKVIQLLTPDDLGLGFYTWSLFGLNRGREIGYGHGGRDPGVNTFVYFGPQTKRGLVVFTNGELSNRLFNLLINTIDEGYVKELFLQGASRVFQRAKVVLKVSVTSRDGSRVCLCSEILKSDEFSLARGSPVPGLSVSQFERANAPETYDAFVALAERPGAGDAKVTWAVRIIDGHVGPNADVPVGDLVETWQGPRSDKR